MANLMMLLTHSAPASHASLILLRALQLAVPPSLRTHRSALLLSDCLILNAATAMQLSSRLCLHTGPSSF